MEVQNLLLIFGGVLVGVLVGALPGLSSPMAIALLMPFTISLDPCLLYTSPRPRDLSTCRMPSYA